jgi:hypothetical protein
MESVHITNNVVSSVMLLNAGDINTLLPIYFAIFASIFSIFGVLTFKIKMLSN